MTSITRDAECVNRTLDPLEARHARAAVHQLCAVISELERAGRGFEPHLRAALFLHGHVARRADQLLPPEPIPRRTRRTRARLTEGAPL